MLTPKPAAVTDIAVFLPCCSAKQGFEVLPGKTLKFKQELCEGRLDDVVYTVVTCNKCGKQHEAEVCRLAYLPKRFVYE